MKSSIEQIYSQLFFFRSNFLTVGWVTPPRMPLKPSFDRQQNTHLPFVCLAETRKQGLIYRTRGGAVRRQEPGGIVGAWRTWGDRVRCCKHFNFFLISPIRTFTSNFTLKTSQNSFAILLYILSVLSVDFVFHIFCVRACLFGFVRFPYATREVVGSETGTYIC